MTHRSISATAATSATSRADLSRIIAADPGLSRALDLARERLSPDPGHDLAHALRVACAAVDIGKTLGVPAREAIAAALLHDIVNVPKNHPDRARASELCAAFAKDVLPTFDFDPDATQRIAQAIADHSFSRGATPVSALGDALQDADRLEALGVIGLMRCVSTGVLMGARYFHDDDPWASSRPLDDRAFSLDHFTTKLLGLPKTMRTEAGRAEAQRRAAFLAHAMDELAHELGVPRPS